MTATTAVLENPTGVLVAKARISSIDLMRGIVMVIMALDHVRDYFHLGAFTYDPTNMATTTPALFFTRWITHYCAPTFVFLAGTSIYMSAQRKSKNEMSVFLLTRGLWLIVLELVVMRFAFFFNFYYDMTILQVIWAIGWCMICMAGLVHFSTKIVLTTGLILIFGHNATDTFRLQPGDNFFVLWSLLNQGGFLKVSENMAFLAFYPLIPWLGIMMAGYWLGTLYTKDFNAEKRQLILFRTGLVATVLFIVLRFINAYGDPAPWSEQKNMVYTVMSFFNTTKYPVSLMYTLMTLGPVLMFLAWMDKRELTVLKPLQVFGRVPLFYFIIHFYLIHVVSLLLYMNKSGKSLSHIDFHFSQSFGGLTPDAGYSLGWVYVAWMAVVILLYPLCKWYNKYKSTHSHWWLSYL